MRKLISLSVCIAAMIATAPVALENADAAPLNPLSGDNGFTTRADAVQLMLIRDRFRKLQLEDDPQATSPLTWKTANDSSSRDIRGRSLQDDFHEFVEGEITRKANATRMLEWALQLNDASEAHHQFAELVAIEESQHTHELAILNYWQSLTAVEREQNLWHRALTKNRLPTDMKHADSVARSELQFRRTIIQDTPLKDSWRAAYKEWIAALIADRNSVVKKIGSNKQHLLEIEYLSRSTPCPAINISSPHPGIASHLDMSAKVNGPVPDVDAYYPEQSRREGVEGVVVLAMKIDAHGCPISAGVSGSSGSDELDAAALKFAETITYNPAIANGEYVSSTQPIAINFKLGKPSDKKN